MITMALDSEQTLNPWDLESGEREPSREQVAFLKGLTRHMLGDIEASDLLDNVLVDAIGRTYRARAMRTGNTIPSSAIFTTNCSTTRTKTATRRSWKMLGWRQPSCATGSSRAEFMRIFSTAHDPKSIPHGSISTSRS